MENNQVSISKTALKYGLISALICIVYFLIMRFSGFIHFTALRLFNYAFIALGLYLAFNEVKHRIHKHRLNYLPGIGMGFMIVFITGALFSLFIFIYSEFLDKGFLNAIKPDLPYYNGSLNGYVIGVFIFTECLMFGVVLTFLVMQLFKRNMSYENEELEEAEEKRRNVNHVH